MPDMPRHAGGILRQETEEKLSLRDTEEKNLWNDRFFSVVLSTGQSLRVRLRMTGNGYQISVLQAAGFERVLEQKNP